MQSLWTTVYGHQKRAKMGQRVHVRMYRHPWLTAFWLAFGFSWNNCKSGARTRNAWRSACDSLRAVRTDPEVSKSMIGNVTEEFYDKGIWKMQKCINRNSDYIKNSWKSSLSINVTFIANKHVFYVKKKKNWRPSFVDTLHNLSAPIINMHTCIFQHSKKMDLHESLNSTNTCTSCVSSYT